MFPEVKTTLEIIVSAESIVVRESRPAGVDGPVFVHEFPEGSEFPNMQEAEAILQGAGYANADEQNRWAANTRSYGGLRLEAPGKRI